MNSKSFFSKIREIIREEIDYALEKKLGNKSKSNDVATLEHGMSLFKESNVKKETKKVPAKSGKYGSIQVEKEQGTNGKCSLVTTIKCRNMPSFHDGVPSSHGQLLARVTSAHVETTW